MSKKQIIPDVLVEIKLSKMLPDEVGLFAVKDIKDGTVIARKEVFDGKFVEWENIDGFSEEVKNKITSFCLGSPKGFILPKDFNELSIGWYMNHSCDGNVGFDSEDNFITIRNVSGGEELCWDYGLGETNPNFRMNCKCGSKKCRKIISGSDWNDPIFYNEHKKYMLSDLIINK